MRKKTHKEFSIQVAKKGVGAYELLSEYVKDNVKVKMKHLDCGHEYEVVPSSFLQGRGCPNCKGKKISEKMSRSLSWHIERARKIDKIGYEILSAKRENGYIYFYVRHDACGREYWVLDSNYRKGDRCRVCAFNEMGKRYRKTDQEFRAEVAELVGSEFEVLSKYEHAGEKVDIKHNKCGFVNSVLPGHFTRNGVRCPKCSGMLKRSTEIFIKEVASLLEDEYEVLGEYKNRQTPIKMRHAKCGLEFYPLPGHFLRGSRCPVCAASRGERAIGGYLKEKGIEFIPQYRTEKCKNIMALPFDFALLDNNKDIIGFIEYQGEQHYRPIAYFGGREGYEKRRRNDKIKRDYCKKEKILLIEVKHDVENIEQHIQEKLKQLAL